jgi:hypothetical protein
LRGKGSRRAENAYLTPKLQAVGRESPSPPLSLRKGEGERHVLLAAGSAVTFSAFSWIFQDFAPFIQFYIHIERKKERNLLQRDQSR